MIVILDAKNIVNQISIQSGCHRIVKCRAFNVENKERMQAGCVFLIKIVGKLNLSVIIGHCCYHFNIF